MIRQYLVQLFCSVLLPCKASLSISMDKPPGTDAFYLSLVCQLAVDGMVHVSSGALQPVFYALIAWLGYLNTFSHGFSTRGLKLQ